MKYIFPYLISSFLVALVADIGAQRRERERHITEVLKMGIEPQTVAVRTNILNIWGAHSSSAPHLFFSLTWTILDDRLENFLRQFFVLDFV